MKVVHIDIGGCEGCGISILRAFPLVKDVVDLTINYLRKEDHCDVEEWDVAIITGGLSLGDGEIQEKLSELRKKSKVLVAFGSCATFGGILRFCVGCKRSFQPVNSLVEVDYSIPGCPPPPQAVQAFFKFLSSGDERRLRVFKVSAGIKKLSGFDLIDDIVLNGLCMGCGVCELSCPTRAIKIVDKTPNLMVEKCIRCGTCYIRCPRASQILSGGGKKW